MVKVEFSGEIEGVEFHHVQIYAYTLQSMEFYKKLEDQVNQLATRGSYDPFSGGMRFLEPLNELPSRVEEGRAVWEEICGNGVPSLDPSSFQGAGQDIIEQLIVGLGWRVTAEYVAGGTRSVLVTSQDARGVKIVVTTKDSSDKSSPVYDHFNPVHLDEFYNAHDGYQGIGVLGFEFPQVGTIEKVYERYKKLHPKLLRKIHEYEDARFVKHGAKSSKVVLGSMQILEAYAYYVKDKDDQTVDTGTVLRFVHRKGSYASKEGFGNPQGVLPGLEDVPAQFDGTSIPAYSDHWVSNVTDRESFLSTLEDVLGFTPKVDFNAGVISAGRAQIESTVTGNTSGNKAYNKEDILRDQSQVYLPINNALTEVGHVHGFLKQLGQGVQHLASRVKDLTAFIERVNNYRRITGRGFTFLNIPRSYYGRLDPVRDLAPLLNNDEKLARSILEALHKADLSSKVGIVALDVTNEKLDCVLGPLIKDKKTLSGVRDAIKLSRYSSLYKLLRDHFCEDTYLQIVRNKILVDIQGNDVLFQIFTCNILQKEPSDEAPFLEFIQRVCSEKKCADGSCAPIRPGCGGFGIKNFLALFLSIELSKAMSEVEASKPGSVEHVKASGRVELFSKQLDESNPILTKISDAMTAEADAQEALEVVKKSKDAKKIKELQTEIEKHCTLKIAGNKELQKLSERYAKLMEEFKK